MPKTQEIESLILTEMKLKIIRQEKEITKYCKKSLMIYRDAQEHLKVTSLLNSVIMKREFVINRKLFKFFKVILIKQRSRLRIVRTRAFQFTSRLSRLSVKSMTEMQKSLVLLLIWNRLACIMILLDVI